MHSNNKIFPTAFLRLRFSLFTALAAWYTRYSEYKTMYRNHALTLMLQSALLQVTAVTRTSILETCIEWKFSHFIKLILEKFSYIIYAANTTWHFDTTKHINNLTA